MSKFTKKAVSVGLSLTTAIWLSGAAVIVPIASAQTSTAELQALINSLLAQIQALQAQLTASTGGAAVASCSFTNDLTVGSKGDDVKCLQQYLNAAGFKLSESGAGSPGSETTYFGPKTKAAVAKWQAAQGVTPSVGYFGPKSRAQYTAVASKTPTVTTPGVTTPTVTVPTDGIVISTAADTPAGAALPKGASGVVALKFNIAGKGTVDTLVFKRTGVGATGDFSSSGIYLYDGSTRLTTGKSLNSTTHEVSYVNLGLKIDGVKTLSLLVDVASAATTGNRDAFELISSAGSPTPTGTAKGGTIEIAGQTVGGVEVARGAVPSNPRIGQANAKLLEFTLTASSTEDIEITRIGLVEGDTITNSNLSNFVLKQGGNTIATASAIGDKDLLTLSLATPFKIEKGQQKTFELFGDVAGATRSSDQIGFYVENVVDVSGKGLTYLYPIRPNITTNIDAAADTRLTVQGGQITISFNGPVAGDVARRASDVTIYDFTITSQNNIEIKNLRFHATTTALNNSTQGFNDMKVWDVAANAVITSAADITTSTDQTYTDVISIKAGESKRYKVTVDVDADNDDSDDILLSLLAFVAGDIKNLDNNTNVAVTDIVPNSTISGNLQDSRVPTLDVQLAASPTSQTQVRGKQDMALAGFSFRASGGDVRLDTLKITATSSSGTLTSSEITSLAVYDGATKISDVKSLDSSLTSTFTGLNYTVKKGETKTLTVKGNLDSNATDTDIYYVYIATNTSTDLTIYDKDGNTATLSGTTANSGNTTNITVASVGNVTVEKAPDDTESEAGIILAGQEQVLGKFKFISINEEMTVNKLQILLASSSSATVTNSIVSDEAPTLKLYEGTTQIGQVAGYPVNASGDFSNIAFISDLAWKVPKDGNKILTVKGVLNSTANGADTGADVYASIMTQADSANTFEAQGASAKDTSITAATGNRKIVYKTKPTLSLPTQGSYSLTSGASIPVFKFKIAADTAGQIWWKKIQFNVSMTAATMSAASTSTVRLFDVTGGGSTELTLSSVYSGTVAAGTTATIVPGTTGYVGLQVSGSGDSINANASKDYELRLQFADLATTAGASKATIQLYRQESSPVNATFYGSPSSGVAANTTSSDNGWGAVDLDMNPSFIWSDSSNTSHATTTADWANGHFVKTFGDPKVVSN